MTSFLVGLDPLALLVFVFAGVRYLVLAASDEGIVADDVAIRHFLEGDGIAHPAGTRLGEVSSHIDGDAHELLDGRVIAEVLIDVERPGILRGRSFIVAEQHPPAAGCFLAMHVGGRGMRRHSAVREHPAGAFPFADKEAELADGRCDSIICVHTLAGRRQWYAPQCGEDRQCKVFHDEGSHDQVGKHTKGDGIRFDMM